MNNYLIMFAHATIVALVQRYRILSACDAFPYTIKFECAAGECAAYLQSVSLPPKNDFEHVRGLRNSAFAVNLT